MSLVPYRAGDEDAFLAGGRDVGATAGAAGLAAAPAAAGRGRRRRRCRAAAAAAESDAGLVPVFRVRPAVLHAAALRRDHAVELRAGPHGELRKHHGLVRRAVRRVLRQAAPCDGNRLVRLGLRLVHTMKKTAPLLEVMPVDSSQVLKSRPTLLRAPGVRAGPSMPMVRKESY